MEDVRVRQFRLVALWEGVSFLVLLLIAMPLKYLLDMPQAVRVVGMAHGGLFVLYVLAVARLTFAGVWSVKQAALAAVASIVPGGTFWLDRQLRAEAARLTPATSDVRAG